MQTESLLHPAADLLLRAVGLSKTYKQGRWSSRMACEVHALRGVHLNLRAGSTLALIGASGSGKSTLALCLSSIEQLDSGEIWVAGKNIAGKDGGLLPFKRQVQTIFQEPGASLNPRLSAVEIVSEPLRIAGQPRKQRHERALELMKLVGLPPDSQKRLPVEFSAGQRRRLAIARALALQPRILILDESLAGLDVSIQAQISTLLLRLQEACSLTYILISHDLDLVAHLADEIAVMHEGRIIETRSTADFFESPRTRQAERLSQASATLSSLRVGAP